MSLPQFGHGIVFVILMCERLFNPHGKYIVKLFVQGKWRQASGPRVDFFMASCWEY